MHEKVKSYGRRQAPERSVDTKLNNCVSSVSGTTEFSKPRFPSPKSEKKGNKSGGTCADDCGDDYINMEDLNVYGNI
ncbi:hypothetical protein PHYPO_G00054870 [Pangasianodon hypophthalmus]|uniref:Uncharacterized protein n=1 Tax=Pangasianodon hypophthalmus TaxID=310915 RepID=A0A5N5M658_PANHP|nr:hypothetical protein PHYPO_G00054870 [Pangasianodon hypophthalmus]